MPAALDKRPNSSFSKSFAQLAGLIPARECCELLKCSRSTYYRHKEIPKVALKGRVYSPRWSIDQAKLRGRP